MHAEYPPIDNGTKCQIIEHFAAPSPDITATIFPLAFVVEPVHLGNLARFMVAADEGHAVRIADFEGEQQEECFHAVESSIHKVP